MSSQVQCQGCNIMLMYPQGASQVRCSQCGHITTPTPMHHAPSHAGHTHRAQLQCSGCQVMLMYPRGAQNVQCAVCGVVNNAQQTNLIAHLQCDSCRTWLMYTYGAQSVKCAVCNTVTQAPPEQPLPMQPHQPQPQPQPQAQQPQLDPERAIYVANPDEGNEGSKHLMLGFKEKS